MKEDGGEGIGPAVTPVGVVEECPSSQPPDPPETDLRRHPTSLPPAEKPLRTAVSGNEQVCHLTGGGSEDDDCRPESIPQAQSLQLRSTAANDRSMTEEGSFDDQSDDDDDDDTSRSEDNSALHSISRVDISSSGMEDTSRMDGDSSHVNESTRMDDSSFMAEDTSQFDGTSHMEDEPSGVADTTRDSHGSSEEEDDLGDGSQVGETSRAEETMDSCLSTRDATLESSLNSSSQLEESHVDLSQMEESNVDLSRISASVTDSFGPFHTSTQGTHQVLSLSSFQILLNIGWGKCFFKGYTFFKIALVLGMNQNYGPCLHMYIAMYIIYAYFLLLLLFEQNLKMKRPKNVTYQTLLDLLVIKPMLTRPRLALLPR